MAKIETVAATSNASAGTFTLDWETSTWTSASSYDEALFPFIAEIKAKRYELFSDGTFHEEELT